MNARELESLETKIASAAKEKAQAEGALGGIMTRLKEEFGLSTAEEAQAEVDRLTQQITKRGAKLETLVEELRAEMEGASK